MASNHLVGGSNPSGCTNNKTSAFGWGFFIGPPRVLVRTPVRQNAKRVGRQRRSAGLVIRLQSDNNPSRLSKQQPNPQPTARFFYCPTQSINSKSCPTKRKAFWAPKPVRRGGYHLPPQTPNPKTPPLKLALTELIKRQFPILTSHSNIGPVIAHLNFANL